MKLITTIKNSALQLCALVMLSFLSVQSFAQDKKVDVNISSGSSNSSSTWYGQPWVWVLGAAVFILLLVLIIRGGGRRD